MVASVVGDSEFVDDSGVAVPEDAHDASSIRSMMEIK